VNWWDLVREASDTFLVQHGVLAALGTRARAGSIVLWQVIAAMEAGTVLGSSLLYLLARRGARGVIERYGPLTGVGPEQLLNEAVRQGFFGLILGLLTRSCAQATARIARWRRSALAEPNRTRCKWPHD
jgi:hypothetical protein